MGMDETDQSLKNGNGPSRDETDQSLKNGNGPSRDETDYLKQIHCCRSWMRPRGVSVRRRRNIKLETESIVARWSASRETSSQDCWRSGRDRQTSLE
jgi:hypothetical protein